MVQSNLERLVIGNRFLPPHIEDQTPIASDVLDFDHGSGSIIERILFNHRPVILCICLAVTIFLGIQATQVKLKASFDEMVPSRQPFILNYLRHKDELQSQGNAIRIAVQANNGTIIDAHYLEMLKEINDKIYLISNVDRPSMTSLWTSSTRWLAVTSQGIDDGVVIDGQYDGSPEELSVVAKNIAKTGKVGELVSNDYTSSMVYVPLLQYDGLTGKNIDYGELARTFNQIRTQYASRGVTLHIIGFAMVVGDMINGIGKVFSFFAISALIATCMLFWFTRCVRSALLVVSASIIAVVWQMGILSLLGFYLTPYSVLVPFLVFAIGMSHGAQKMNGVMQDIGRGAHPLIAARFTFRRLFLAGFAALVCDAASFAVLLAIDIRAIHELALLASIGVAILIFTNLIMLPIILSYVGVSKQAAIRSLRDENSLNSPRAQHPIWNFLVKFTTKRYAVSAIAISVILGGVGLDVGRHVQVGDLAPGAPELRQDSQYNRDNVYILDHYTTSTDTMVAMVDTVPNGCVAYPVLYTVKKLAWQLDQMPEVQSTSSLGTYDSGLTMMMNENSPKWYDLPLNQPFLSNLWSYTPLSLANFKCNFMPLYIFLRDHRAATLTAVVDTTEKFIANPLNRSPDFKISLVGGNAGIEAATNIVISKADDIMLLLVYITVVIFCFIVFRSWRAVLCAVLPLVLTSILGQALMVWIGIGIKVATLPVMALGVGIGVDYAIYILGIVIKQLKSGATLSQAYHRTLLFTGKVVLLTGCTLAVGVMTWMFAPIKFQADMGLLLSFMFLWNMLGALVLLPSLAYFLLPPHIFESAIASAKIGNAQGIVTPVLRDVIHE